MARINLPINLIGRSITTAAAWVTATGAEGMVFGNNDGNIFLEVISTTTAQAFTVQTGLVLPNELGISEFAVADTNATISLASTPYPFGAFPPNIYNQPGTENVYVDHAVGAVLQMRAWKLV